MSSRSHRASARRSHSRTPRPERHQVGAGVFLDRWRFVHRPRTRGVREPTEVDRRWLVVHPDDSFSATRAPHARCRAELIDAPPHPAPAFVAAEEAGVGQHLGVVGDRGLRLAERFEEIARADLSRLGHETQEADAYRVGERGEGAGEVLGLLLVERGNEEASATSSCRNRFPHRCSFVDSAATYILTTVDVSIIVDLCPDFSSP